MLLSGRCGGLFGGIDRFKRNEGEVVHAGLGELLDHLDGLSPSSFPVVEIDRENARGRAELSEFLAEPGDAHLLSGSLQFDLLAIFGQDDSEGGFRLPAIVGRLGAQSCDGGLEVCHLACFAALVGPGEGVLLGRGADPAAGVAVGAMAGLRDAQEVAQAALQGAAVSSAPVGAAGSEERQRRQGSRPDARPVVPVGGRPGRMFRFN